MVGYKVRFTDRVRDDTLVKVMTDGILLAEVHGDRWLSQYDTLIIDEAHERSVNIDFLLGTLTPSIHAPFHGSPAEKRGYLRPVEKVGLGALTEIARQ